jgi:hypothetical protein
VVAFHPCGACTSSVIFSCSRPSMNMNALVPLMNAWLASMWLVRTDSSSAFTRYRAVSRPSCGASTTQVFLSARVNASGRPAPSAAPKVTTLRGNSRIR